MPPKRKGRPPKGDSKPSKAKKAKKAGEQGAEFDLDEYNGNCAETRARFFRTIKSATRGGEIYVETDWKEPPTDPEDMHQLIIQNGMIIGDIVSWGEVRENFSYYVIRQEDKMALQENHDETDAGYLSVPRELLKLFPDPKEKYRKVMEDRCMNMKFLPETKYVKETFGDIPEEWLIDVFFNYNEYSYMQIYNSDGVYLFGDGSDNITSAKNRINAELGLEPVEEDVSSDEDWSPGGGKRKQGANKKTPGGGKRKQTANKKTPGGGKRKQRANKKTKTQK